MKIALLLTLWGSVVVRDPDSGNPVRWTTPSIAYYLDPNGVAAITDGSDMAAMRASLAAWNAVSCSTFNFSESGTDNGRSIRFFTSESAWNDAGGSDGAAAYTVRSRSGATWTGANIIVADYDIPWGTNGDLRKIDLQAVITHELGHAIGLQHSGDPRTTMYFNIHRGSTSSRLLSDEDISAACFLYPAASQSCASNSDCPIFNGSYGGGTFSYVCDNGACVAGTRGYGEDCFADSHCADARTCVRFDGTPEADPGLCTVSCGCDDTSCCASGDACIDGYCAPHAVDCPASCDALAQGQCAIDVDGGYVCAETCIATSNNCDDGFVCFQPVSAQDAGVCRKPGAKATGLSCTAASDCASLVCTVNEAGQQRCVGEELTTPTDTDPDPVDDGEPYDDGESTSDGGGSGDGDGGSADDFANSEDDPLDDGVDGDVGGGCAATTPSFVIMVTAMLGVWMVRRRDDAGTSRAAGVRVSR